MPANAIRPLLANDPAVLWLAYHGHKYGLLPDEPRYSFATFMQQKQQQFVATWCEQIAPNDVVTVCEHHDDIHDAARVAQTIALMRLHVPVIRYPALWYPEEMIYGVPDIIIHTSWLATHMPLVWHTMQQAQHTSAMNQDASHTVDDAADNIDETHETDHYVILLVKFITTLTTAHKSHERQLVETLIHFYSAILAHIQQHMPFCGLVVTRSRIINPHVMTIPAASSPHPYLDKNLVRLRHWFQEIRRNRAGAVPWHDAQVAPNFSNDDEQWHTAKRIIATEKMPGGSVELLYGVGAAARQELAALGYSSLAALQHTPPTDIPFERCSRIQKKAIRAIRAILHANASGKLVRVPLKMVPPKTRYEFFVDFEYFSHANVQFDTQWHHMNGCEMLFMMGVGYEQDGTWHYRQFAADAENRRGEQAMIMAFLAFLEQYTNGIIAETGIAQQHVTLYHWTQAEVKQAQIAANRYNLPASHLLRHLPWYDVCHTCMQGACAIPGAWNYNLKQVARALATAYPSLDPQWPDELDDSLKAMVMGWHAYQSPHPNESHEMHILTKYLEADCRAVYSVVRWLRMPTE